MIPTDAVFTPDDLIASTGVVIVGGRIFLHVKWPDESTDSVGPFESWADAQEARVRVKAHLLKEGYRVDPPLRAREVG